MTSPVTPISSVPGEILGEIFLMCTTSPPIPDPDKAPVVFTRVSRWFRHVALTTPRLWSEIAIPSRDEIGRYIDIHNGNNKVEDPPNKHTQYLALITDWLLVRSGATPLNIKFVNHIGWGIPSSAALLDVFFSCRARWQNIDVSKADKSVFREIAQLHERDTPCLRSLCLGYSNTAEYLPHARILLSPKLQQIEIQSPEEFTLHPDMSWANLTDIYLTNFVGPLFPLLRQANHLRSLNLDAESIGIARSTIDLPELVTLHIYGTWNPGLQSLLAHLSCPRLEDLVMHTYQMGQGTLAQLVDFTSHTNRLKTLLVRDIDYDSLADILRFTPELKKLTIRPCPKFTREESNDFFNAFVAEDADERVCSYLEEFECSSGLDPDEETVRRLYERKLGNTPGISAWKRCYTGARGDTRGVGFSSELVAIRDPWAAYWLGFSG